MNIVDGAGVSRSKNITSKSVVHAYASGGSWTVCGKLIDHHYWFCYRAEINCPKCVKIMEAQHDKG
jgi:hypothetical protein